jgi:hypothetical protein
MYYLNKVSQALLFFWDITQRRLVILYRRLGTTYRSHLQGSIRSETSVKDCHLTLRNIPEERRSHQHRGGSLKSRKGLRVELKSNSLLHSYLFVHFYYYNFIIIRSLFDACKEYIRLIYRILPQSSAIFIVVDFLSGEGPRSRCYGRTAALRLIVQPCDEDD